MKFILWTLVFWTIIHIERWIGIYKVGPSEYNKWLHIEYGDNVVAMAFLVEMVLYILLYKLFVQ